MEYRIQRPGTVWVETVVEADNLEQALDIADDAFVNGDFQEMDDSFSIDYDKFWSKDEKGKENA
jgi:hypothetical protein